MKVSELRVGNFIMYSDIKKVFNVDLWIFAELKYGISKIDEFEPIPITEEWLIRFGFEKYDNPNNTSSWVWIKNREKWFFQTWKDIKNFSNFILLNQKQIKYIHQIQNLYFALTGEELEIK